jgi:hypothetical protein
VIAALQRFLSEHRQFLAALGLVLLGNVAFYLLLTGPAQLRSRLLRGDLEAAEKDALNARREYGKGLLEARLMDAARQRLDRLYGDTWQGYSERYAVVDEKIKDLTRKHGLTPPQSSAYAYDALLDERLERMSVSFNLKGSYDNLRRFLADVEKASGGGERERDLFFTIEKIGLSDSTEAGTELNLQITLSTYFHQPSLAAEAERRDGTRREGTRDGMRETGRRGRS